MSLGKWMAKYGNKGKEVLSGVGSKVAKHARENPLETALAGATAGQLGQMATERDDDDVVGHGEDTIRALMKKLGLE